MCRIGGIQYGKDREELSTAEIAVLMFAEMEQNGPHAWGFATYSEEDQVVTWSKTEGKCDSKRARRIQIERIDPNAKWAIFHSRYATHGSPSNNLNNHPIRHHDIIGVHNGVLENHEKILRITGRYDDKTEVDSEAIFAAINKWGPNRGMRKIRGKAVAVFTDLKAPHLLRIARTHSRSLNLGWTTRGSLMFATEKKALLALEPWINFEHFSVVGENKLLTLRNGQIVARHQFMAPQPVVVQEPQPEWMPDLVRFSRASRRGTAIFPKGPTPEPDLRDENGNHLFVWRDLLLTEDEYLDALMNPQNWEHLSDDPFFPKHSI